MTDVILKRLRELMAIADLADGTDDGKIHKANGAEYMDALIERAGQVHCHQEQRFLKQIKAALQSLRGDTLPSAESGPDWLINKVLKMELRGSDEGKQLLDWKDVPPPCKGMDYSLPAHMQVKSSRAR